MSWIQKLYETYERCSDAPQFDDKPLNPMSSQYQDTQIQIAIDGEGNFRRAERSELRDTVIPVSEESSARTSNAALHPHPLTDKLGYCAGDLANYGGEGRRFGAYEKQLKEWCDSEHCDPKASAVLHYIEKRTLVRDLVREKVLQCSDGTLSRLKISKTKIIDAKDAWIRWRVEMPVSPEANTWEDGPLFERWRKFENAREHTRGFCMVAGKDSRLMLNHPKGIRNNADSAKLISSNDETGFTFLGRFREAQQAAGVGYEITQKAHNALRWLIKRQGHHNANGQVFVAWAVSGQRLPDPLRNTAHLLSSPGADDRVQDDSYSGDAGQQLALRLNTMISGYRSELGDLAEIVVMGLDSATPGRMAITYYRELLGAEFLDRVLGWHARYAWRQNYYGEFRFVGAPAPEDIAEVAYPGPSHGKLRKATVERLLPCIVDARPLPRDVMEATVRRAVNRVGCLKDDGIEREWEKCLGVACALVRGVRWEENYQMSLEENRTTRDYLFGRLLAIGEDIERRALYLANETRDTNAARLMQRFADHPCSTWRNIELALTPYKARLRSNRPGVLFKREELLDSVICMFMGDDFANDSKLSGEFLLGYHCQRSALWKKGASKNDPEDVKSEPEGEEE